MSIFFSQKYVSFICLDRIRCRSNHITHSFFNYVKRFSPLKGSRNSVKFVTKEYKRLDPNCHIIPSIFHRTLLPIFSLSIALYFPLSILSPAWILLFPSSRMESIPPTLPLYAWNLFRRPFLSPFSLAFPHGN